MYQQEKEKKDDCQSSIGAISNQKPVSWVIALVYHNNAFNNQGGGQRYHIFVKQNVRLFTIWTTKSIILFLNYRESGQPLNIIKSVPKTP